MRVLALADEAPPADAAVLVQHVGRRQPLDQLGGLREWVERHRPRYLLHGHATPDPRTQTHRLGDIEVVWVRGVALLELEWA
jgi:uncharacterized protein